MVGNVTTTLIILIASVVLGAAVIFFGGTMFQTQGLRTPELNDTVALTDTISAQAGWNLGNATGRTYTICTATTIEGYQRCHYPDSLVQKFIYNDTAGLKFKTEHYHLGIKAVDAYKEQGFKIVRMDLIEESHQHWYYVTMEK